MTTQTLENNKKIARQSIEAFEKKDYNLLEKITDTSKFKLHVPGNKNPLNYKEAVKFNNEYNTAFPDTKVTIESQVAEGDHVVTKLSYHGTHKGELQGIPASGKKVKVTGMSLQRIVNGKIVEEWDEMDSLGMMKQIGAIPEPEHAQH